MRAPSGANLLLHLLWLLSFPRHYWLLLFFFAFRFSPPSLTAFIRRRSFVRSETAGCATGSYPGLGLLLPLIERVKNAVRPISFRVKYSTGAPTLTPLCQGCLPRRDQWAAREARIVRYRPSGPQPDFPFKQKYARIRDHLKFHVLLGRRHLLFMRPHFTLPPSSPHPGKKHTVAMLYLSLSPSLLLCSLCHN